MRGFLGYQGESNVGDVAYEEKMETVISSWREKWGRGDIPFYFVQLAPHKCYSGEKLGRMWEARSDIARKVAGTGMAIIADNKQFKTIHPGNKPDVGKRLALLAYAKTYGKKLVWSGPLYKANTVKGDRMIIEFEHAEGGLANAGEAITDVFIKGEGDADFVAAMPVIEGDKLVVSRPAGRKPLSVRMGWNAGAMPTLMNKEGLSASPFLTDTDG